MISIKRSSLKLKVDKLYDLYLEGDIDKEMLTTKTNKLKEQIEHYDSRLSEMNISHFEHLEIEKIREYMYDLREKILVADINFKKEIVDALVDNIIIHNDEVNINFKLIPIGSKTKITSTGKEVTQGKVGGGEESRTPVQEVSHIQSSTV